MILNSYAFLFGYLPVVLAGTFLCARFGPSVARLWLTAASLAFYATWNPAWLPVLLGSAIFNYFIASAMTRTELPRRRAGLWGAAAAVDLGVLGYFKYTGFMLDAANAIAGTGYTWYEVTLPLGISFFTFQQMTLLADIDSGHVRSVRFSDFLLFVVFFPHLIAGPIVHHAEMMPQFERESYRLNLENMSIGLVLLCAGLFKKSILADGIAAEVTPVFNAAARGEPVSFAFAWLGATGFTLQMYFDFSGYCDMALGLARMVGIKLPMNFNSPLKALSMIDYWARWHMTLTRFLTAYVFNPLAMAQARRRRAAGKRGLAGTRTSWGAFFTIVALPAMATMFLSGLWHGAGAQFLIFGLIHGAALVANHAWRLIRPRIWPDSARYHRLVWPLAWALTFLTATVALIWFHAASVAAGGRIVLGMIGAHGWFDTTSGQEHRSGPAAGLLWILGLMAIALIPPNTLESLRRWEPATGMAAETPRQVWMRWPTFAFTPAWAFGIAALGVIGVLGLGQVSEFLYWQF